MFKRKRITAFILSFVMLFIMIVPHFDFLSGFGLNTYAESLYNQYSQYVGKAIQGLRFNLTYVNNNGNYRTQHPNGGFYLRNRLRKEFIEGDAVDPLWDRISGHYCWCIANHTVSPKPGEIPIVYGVYDSINRPQVEENRTMIDEFNFYFAAVTLYYMSQPENRDSLYDKYDDLTQYIIAKSILGPTFEKGFLHGEWGFDNMACASSALEIYGNDFNPDTTGSTRIYDELNAPVKSPIMDGNWTHANQVIWDLWNAAKTLSALGYEEQEGFCAAPVIAQESDGMYHAKVHLKDITNTFLSELEADKVYGDWSFEGLKNDSEGQYLDFKSPTGEMPTEGKIADMKLRPDNSFENLNTDFRQAVIVRFKFLDANGNRTGQDMLVGDFQGDFSVAIKETTTTPPPDTGKPQPSPGGYNVHVDRYEHNENWQATYNVNLIKYDSETGEPLEGSTFDILEAFDSTQLDTNVTPLDISVDNIPAHSSNKGSLNSTEWGDDDISSNYNGDTGVADSDANLYNWGNDNGSQFEKWDGWDEGNQSEVCTRDNDVTGPDGYLYTSDTDGNANMDRPAHTDIKKYTYNKGYCGGHPAPEIDYEELTGDPEQDAAIEAANQELHNDAWEAWYAEVETCEELASQGGFFHAIDEGAAQEAMEKDRDDFYLDFISLEYIYSAVETTARDGYIIHGTHTDDIPIEVRIVTSSELKDYNSGTGIVHGSANDTNEDEDTDTTANYLLTNKTLSNNILSSTPSTAKKTQKNYKSIREKRYSDIDSVDNNNGIVDDIDITSDDTLSSDVIQENNNSYTTSSNAEKKENVTEHDFYATNSNAERKETVFGKLSLSSLLDSARENLSNIKKSFVSLFSNEEKNANESFLRDTMTFLPSIAEVIVPNKDDIIDWTFIVYDHRTEGEIHFNKRDLNLVNSDDYEETYAGENGDGTLEGAVYGLFAKNDIIHPDGKTGTVYKQNDLVAVATTDRNGDASFMA